MRLYYSNLALALEHQRMFDSATTILDRFEGRFPGNPEVSMARIFHAVMQKDYRATEDLGQTLLAAQRGTVYWEATAYEWMATLDAMRGRMAAAQARWRRSFELTAERGLRGQYLLRAARRAVTEALLLNDRARGRKILEESLDRFPMKDLSPLDRPYLRLALAYAVVGDPQQARAFLSEYEATPEADHNRMTELWKHGALGVLALSEGRPEDAIAELHRFDEGNGCNTCAPPWLARAFELAGQPDSARILHEKFAETPSNSIWYDAPHLGYSYLRLGELYEQQGDPAAASVFFRRFAELWADADAEFQSEVEAARQAAERLSGGIS
jgi:tetratricopeptide (TPR) repeat protein